MGMIIRRAAGLAVAIGIATTAARGDEIAGLDYPSFGVSLIGPTGWAGKFVAGKYVVARWQKEDDETLTVRGVVEIRALPAGGMTLRQFADMVGKQFGGEVVDKSLKVDGAAAWRLEVPQPDESRGAAMRLRGAVVVEHDGVMYAVLGAGTPGVDWLAAVRQVLGRWKWIPIESPAKRLRYLDARAVLLDGRVSVPLPVGMGMAEADRSWNDPADAVTLGLCNFKRGGDDFEMTVRLEDLREGETIETYRERLIGSLRTRTSLPLDWREVPDREGRRATQLTKVSENPDGTKNYDQYACFEAGGHQAIVVTFRVVAADDEELGFYAHQAAYMLREMEVLQKPAATGADNGR